MVPCSTVVLILSLLRFDVFIDYLEMTLPPVSGFIRQLSCPISLKSYRLLGTRILDLS